MKSSDGTVRKVVRAFVSKVPAGVRGYVRENWGAPFIVGFMGLLMAAAVALSLGFAVFADEVAVYAYFALVVGVVLQLASFLKYRKREGELGQ